MKRFAFDRLSSQDQYKINVQDQLSNLEANDLTPELTMFLAAQTPVFDFSKGASSVKFEFVRYTTPRGNSLAKADSFSNYSSSGFDNSAFSWVQETDSDQAMFHFKRDTKELIITPQYSCIDGSQCKVPAGYYEAELTLQSVACSDVEYCDYTIDIMKESLYFYICEDCLDWTLVISDDILDMIEETIEIEFVEPEPVDLETDHNALFEEALHLFSDEFSLFVFIIDGDEPKEFDFSFIRDRLFDGLNLDISYGSSVVEGFCKFRNGILKIGPDSDVAYRQYELKMMLSDSHGNEFGLKMRINVKEPQRLEIEEEFEDEYFYEDEMYFEDMYYDDLSDPTMLSDTRREDPLDDPARLEDPARTEEEEKDEEPIFIGPIRRPPVFIRPNPSDLTIDLREKLTLDYRKFVNRDAGTVKFSKFELLGMGGRDPIATIEGKKLVVRAFHPWEAGEYPFVLRVTDDQNQPKSDIFMITIVDPEAPIREERYERMDDEMMRMEDEMIRMEDEMMRMEDDPLTRDECLRDDTCAEEDLRTEDDLLAEDKEDEEYDEDLDEEDSSDLRDERERDPREDPDPRDERERERDPREDPDSQDEREREPREPREPVCDARCEREKREEKRREEMATAQVELDRVRENFVTEKKIEIEISVEVLDDVSTEVIEEFIAITEDLEIDLEAITSESAEEQDEEVIAIMEKVADMPVVIQ